ncbi:hypothetical protein B0H14DRAFT_2612321 [Mycena olivaceomarginata]|nr:hypothetical protein B0H14DRAFT_2612321 [Mycena olivaceomarginata]
MFLWSPLWLLILFLAWTGSISSGNLPLILFMLNSFILSASVPVVRGNIGVVPSSSLVSAGGPGAGSTSSPIHRTRGIDDVAACTLVARTPRTRGAQTPRTRGAAASMRGVQNVDDIIVDVELPVNTVHKSLPPLSSSSSSSSQPGSSSSSRPEDDPFVYLTVQEKLSVVRFLVVDKRVPVAVLRKMGSRHTNFPLVLHQFLTNSQEWRTAVTERMTADLCLCLHGNVQL